MAKLETAGTEGPNPRAAQAFPLIVTIKRLESLNPSAPDMFMIHLRSAYWQATASGSLKLPFSTDWPGR